MSTFSLGWEKEVPATGSSSCPASVAMMAGAKHEGHNKIQEKSNVTLFIHTETGWKGYAQMESSLDKWLWTQFTMIYYQ